MGTQRKSEGAKDGLVIMIRRVCAGNVWARVLRRVSKACDSLQRNASASPRNVPWNMPLRLRRACDWVRESELLRHVSAHPTVLTLH